MSHCFDAKGLVQEGLHQLGGFRLVRIVAGEAIGRGEGLSLVRLHQTGVLHIVTIDAQRGSVLGQVKIKFALAALARLVHRVAGVAAHVECGVAAALLRNIRSLRVAGEAEIVFLIARGQPSVVDSYCRKCADRGRSGNREPPAGELVPLICVESLSAWQVRQSL